MSDDDDLFAALTTPPPPRPVRRKPVPEVSKGCASLACPCGFRDEVKEPCPDRLDCPECHGLETLARIVPRYAPPAGAGRDLTERERRAIA